MFSSASLPIAVPDNKDLCILYFGKNPVSGKKDTWKCSCGTIRKQNVKLGYTNLVSHIKQKHPNYLGVFQMDQQVVEEQSKISAESTGSVSKQATLSYMFDSHSSNIFKWLEWVVMEQCDTSWLRLTVNFT
jgi:hypothetical protein